MNILKKSLLVLAGTATLAVAGTASAMSPPYAMCVLKGPSTLGIPGGASVSCWTTLVTKIDCSGNVQVVAVGAVPDDTNPDPNCYGLATADLPWETTTADIIAGGSIDTDVPGFGIPSVINAASGTPLAAGTLNGVGPAGGTTSVVCDSTTSPATMVTVPTTVPVNGSFTGGGATFVSTGLDLKGCFPVP